MKETREITSWTDLTSFDLAGYNDLGREQQSLEPTRVVRKVADEVPLANNGPSGMSELGGGGGGGARKEDQDDFRSEEGVKLPLPSRLVRIVARMVDAYYPQQVGRDDKTGKEEAMQIEQITFSPYRVRESLVFDMDIYLDWA